MTSYISARPDVGGVIQTCARSEAQQEKVHCREDGRAVMRKTASGGAKVALRYSSKLRSNQDVRHPFELEQRGQLADGTLRERSNLAEGYHNPCLKLIEKIRLHVDEQGEDALLRAFLFRNTVNWANQKLRTSSENVPCFSTCSLYAAMASRLSWRHFLRFALASSSASALSRAADRLMPASRAAASRSLRTLTLVARLEVAVRDLGEAWDLQRMRRN